MPGLSQLLAIGHALALLPVLAPTTAQELAGSPELYWSYGRSPPVYPSRKFTHTCDHISDGFLVTVLTQSWLSNWDWHRGLGFCLQQSIRISCANDNAEKENMTYGHPSTNGCSGNSGAVPRLGFPGICLNDAGNGVRATDVVNGYASGVHVGASWNTTLAYNRALFMGAEFKAKGGTDETQLPTALH